MDSNTGEAEPVASELEPGQQKRDIKTELIQDRVQSMLLVCTMGWAFFCCYYSASGAWNNVAWHLLVTGLSLGLTLKARQVQSLPNIQLIVNGNLLICLLGMVVAGQLQGGSDSLALWFMPSVSLLAVFQTESRYALVWTALTIVGLIAQTLSPPWLESYSDFQANWLDKLMAQCIMALILFGLGAAVKRESESAIQAMYDKEEQLLERNAQLRAQALELEKTRDEALKAARAKSEFLANMSHEIRTPLNGLLGMAQIMSATELTEHQREILRTIDTSGGSLLSIVNNVVDLSRIEAGRLQLEQAPVDVRELIYDTLDIFSQGTWKKGLDLAGHVHKDLPRFVLTDSTRLQQILVNLIGNALKFTSEGEITMSAIGLGDDMIEFRVRDTGIGIPKEKRALVFQVFSQVDASTTRKYGGSGLGLAITRRLVELMEGEIDFKSELGRGTTFRFTIRAPETDAPADVEVEEDKPLDLKDRSLLIIDPMKTSRELLAEQARQWQMDVFDCSEWVEAERFLKSHSCDLVMISAMLADPLAVRRHIRRINSDLSVALLTTSAEVRYVKEASQLGFAGVVLKPVRIRRLQRVLESILFQKKAKTSRIGPAVEGNLARELPTKILVAEDNVINQNVVLFMLKSMGFKPVLAKNGLEAVEKVKAESFDLIFMDMHMPELDGLGAAKQICQELEPAPDIIALTANVLPEQRRECEQAGMSDFVAKPFQIKDLADAIRRSAERRGLSAKGAN